MPGRAKIEIDAKELDVFESLANELKQRGYVINDDSRVKVTFLAPYQSKPAIDIKIILDRLSRHIDINGNKVVTKKELCKILDISRPTLDGWTNRGWITIRPTWYGPYNNGKDYRINLIDIKNQLLKMTLLLLQTD